MSIVNGKGITNLSINGTKSSVIIGIITPLAAAVLGAYAAHTFALWRAQQNTANGTQTLLGITKDAIELAQTNSQSPQLLEKLELIERQARAVQANVESLQSPKGKTSLQADFWLSLGQGALLPHNNTIGVNYVYNTSKLKISFNSASRSIRSGEKISYKVKNDSNCHVVYMGASPDQKLHGFKAWCDK